MALKPLSLADNPFAKITPISASARREQELKAGELQGTQVTQVSPLLGDIQSKAFNATGDTVEFGGFNPQELAQASGITGSSVHSPYGTANLTNAAALTDSMLMSVHTPASTKPFSKSTSAANINRPSELSQASLKPASSDFLLRQQPLII